MTNDLIFRGPEVLEVKMERLKKSCVISEIELEIILRK